MVELDGFLTVFCAEILMKFVKFNWSVLNSVMAFAPPIILGAATIYFELFYNTTLAPKEIIFINVVQFIASAWFGWVLSFIFSERTFQEKQKKFAISAFRRIKEIEHLTERLIVRIREKEKMNKSIGIAFDPLKEMVLSLRSTVRSSKADWGDVIGDEIKVLDDIAKIERDESSTSSSVVEKIENMLSTLPSTLAIDARQDFSSDERIALAEDNFLDQASRFGYIQLEGFWDKSFDKDILDVELGSSLFVAIDDVADRVGALIARSEDGKPVGVIVNDTDVCDYEEFVEALRNVLGKSRFQAEYAKMGVKMINPDKDGEGDRHYFECIVRVDGKMVIDG